MLRQVLVAPSRALRSSARSIAQRPLSRPQSLITPLTIRSIQPAAARWYSDAPKETPEAAAPEATAPEAAAEAKEAAPAVDPAVAELQTKLEAKEKEAMDWKDKCLRSVADFRNLQDRTQREVKTARDFAIQSFAKDLVESVDNLDRALSTVPETKLTVEEKSEDLQELVNFYEGLKMTETILMNTLKKHGLERVDPLGEKFNANEHEAIMQTPSADKENNTILMTQQKGFKLNGRVLRAPKVIVVKN